MKIGKVDRLLVGALAAVGVLTPGAFGAALVSFTGGRPTDVENKGVVNTTFGYRIRLADPIVVTHLGVYDVGGNGLDQQHPVGIWNASDQLVATATVPQGTSATLSGGFRYVALAEAVTLPAGTYDLGAHYFNIQSGLGDPYMELVETVTLPAGASFESALFDNSFFGLTQPQPPLFGNFGRSFIGPGALYTAVPEPVALGVATALLVGVGIRQWRRCRQLAA